MCKNWNDVCGRNHDYCRKNFFRISSVASRGRPKLEELKKAMELIFSILNSSDECQWSHKDLENCKSISESLTISVKHLHTGCEGWQKIDDPHIWRPSRNGFEFILVGSIIKAEPHICKFSENSWERWVRTGERVMCGSVYSYILGIRHYAVDRFSTLPNFWKRRISANTSCKSQFSRLLVNLCENARECYEYSVFAYSRPYS